MSLEKQLEDAIYDECKKQIRRYHEYQNARHLEFVRHSKRVSPTAPKLLYTPEHWSFDRKFNPFYVLSKRKSIARAIARKISLREYIPNPPHIKTVPKPDGGDREIAIYEIPDSAVSKLFYSRLLSKNKHRFSSFSYAYRNDRNVHFAIQDIWLDISYSARSFIAEFDFSDFFGSISHDYLRSI